VCPTDVVPAPKNLRFSATTQTSFKAHWEHGAPDVALYRIGWSKKGDIEPKYVREHRDAPRATRWSVHKLGLKEYHRNGLWLEMGNDPPPAPSLASSGHLENRQEPLQHAHTYTHTHTHWVQSIKDTILGLFSHNEWT